MPPAPPWSRSAPRPTRLTTEVRVAERTTDHLAELDGLRKVDTLLLPGCETRGAERHDVRCGRPRTAPPATFTTTAAEGTAGRRRIRNACGGSHCRTALPGSPGRTDEPATSTRCGFGKSRASGCTEARAQPDALTRRHTIVITGLRPQRRDYALRIGSRDDAGNAAAPRSRSVPRPGRWASR